ncbi:MAG: formimidoylglutamase [Bacteroidota bacterium]
MAKYMFPQKKHWSGRISDKQHYLHEKVTCLPIDELKKNKNHFVLLGYACDEGVRRNLGRVGAKNGPKAIREALGKMPNHLNNSQHLFDIGDVLCPDLAMEEAQEMLSDKVYQLLQQHAFPILLGGGHDIAYGHYNGIKRFLLSKKKRPAIGIINFDAHFDLREDHPQSNSGTPFYQLANENEPFPYLCLGIRKDANDRTLFETAAEMDVTYVLQNTFRIEFVKEINTWIKAFIANVDHVYVTIDLDGFSSAYAPGVSAASPMGFSPDIVLESLETIITSGKLISVDVAEMNPEFDRDGSTAKLAASLIHKVIHSEFP